MSRRAKIGATIGALLLVLSLYLSNEASQQAKDLASKRHADYVAAQILDYKRAIGACVSSGELRSLLDRLDALLIDPATTDPEVKAAHEAIKAYTGSNPNCQNLPLKPKGAS